MIRFYQPSSDYDEWKLANDDDPHQPWEFANRLKAQRVSILTLSADPDIAKAEDIHYAGPLMFDIDDGADLERAIQSGRELCKKLVSLGVDPYDLEIHLSGSKGIHVYLNQKIFSQGKEERDLTAIYKRMATELFVPCLDMAVYSGKKGRMVRPINARRPDGKYKVCIDLDTLDTLTADVYRELVKNPGEITSFEGPCRKSKTLASMFNRLKSAKDLALELQTARPDAVPTDISALEGNIPPCVDDLAKGKRSSATFNQVALNVACWSAASGMPDELLESLYDRIVENNPSSKGKSKLARKRELQAMHQYVASDRNKNGYKFSCQGMLSVIETKPCSGCPVKLQMNLTQALPDHVYIYENNGQWFSDSDNQNLISTFTMERDAVLEDDETGVIMSSTFSLVIPSYGKTYKLENFYESAWRNKANFKQAIEGIDGAAFFGSDNDVTRIRMTVTKKEITSGVEMGREVASTKVGITYRRRRGPTSVLEPGHVGRLTYVENEGSINEAGIPNTHRYVGATQPSPKLLRQYESHQKISDEGNHAFGLLLKCNQPEVIAPVLGWYLLAHIKQHVYQIEHRSPLLCISGVAGTGKNSLAGVMQRLAGLEGEDALYTLEAPNSTLLPFQQAVSNTSTIPRVINEMNPKSVSRQQYRQLVELLKAAFDSQNVNRGRIGGNANKNDANVSTISWQITAPVLTLSEEPINDPALMQRAVMVNMTPAGHDYGSKYFVELEKMADKLTEIAWVLVRGALNTKVLEIHRRLKETRLPAEMEAVDLPARLRFGYTCILMAYDWAIEVLSLDETGFSEDNVKSLTDMRTSFVNYMSAYSGVISKASQVTEVDKVLRDLAVLAYSSHDANVSFSLERGKHFVAIDGTLYLDVPILYPIYQRYKMHSPEPIRLTTAEAFMQTVKSMSYYVSETAVTDLLPTGGRPVLALNLELMQGKGIPVQMFI